MSSPNSIIFSLLPLYNYILRLINNQQVELNYDNFMHLFQYIQVRKEILYKIQEFKESVA